MAEARGVDQRHCQRSRLPEQECIPKHGPKTRARPCGAPKTFSSDTGAHCRTGMATADKPMQLPIGQLKKPFCLAVGVILQSFRTKDGIFVCHSHRRIRASHPIAYGRRLTLCLGKCSQASIGLPLQKFRPSHEPCFARGRKVLEVCMDPGSAPQRVKRVVLHRSLL